jgi:hypothetical protein
MRVGDGLFSASTVAAIPMMTNKTDAIGANN